MLFLTAKLDKRKVVGGALILVALVAAAILIFGGGGDKAEPAAKLSAVVKNNEQRVSYLKSLGWQVEKEPVEEQSVTIPKDFSDVYEEYNALQRSQGFDLKKYSGLEATRYTYEVTNHPDASGRVVADMIVYRGEVIAADIQSLAADGFMEGIEFPRS